MRPTYFAQIIAMLVALYKLKNSVLQPTLWAEPTPVPSAEGPLLPNSMLSLDNVLHITGNFAGPESVAFDPDNNEAYASFNDGTVGKFSGDGKIQERIFFFTAEFVKNLTQHESKELFEWCQKEAYENRISWKAGSEEKCGRPLGLRFRKVFNCLTL
jgi:hypothetical protein